MRMVFLLLTSGKNFFKMFELKQIVRQRESKQFAELLNRLREGNRTKEDIAKLKDRCISETSPSYPKDAPHLFIQNGKVNNFNDIAHNALSGTKYSIKAHDSVVGADTQELRDKILNKYLAIQGKPNSCILYYM